MQPNIDHLSERQRQALRLLARGHDAKSAAQALGVSVHSINERLRDARRKLGVGSSREAARIFLESEADSPPKSWDEKIGVDLPSANVAKKSRDGRRQSVGRTLLAHIGVAMFLFTAAALALWTQPPQGAPEGSAFSLAANSDPGDALVTAVRHRDNATIVRLLDAGADPNAQVPNEGTPLINAVRLRDPALVRLLLERGAKADLAAVGDGSPLIAAARAGDANLIDALIARGAAVDTIVPGDETPLINAARSGSVDAVRRLVEHGAAVNLKVLANADRAPEWRSPLGEAIKTGRGNIVAYLRERGARQ